MKRFPAFDPPEYVSWQPDPALVRRFRETIETDGPRRAVVAGLSRDDLLHLYAGLVRARLHDVTLKRWVRTGVISKAWLGTGEEATTVGPVHALERGRDVVSPMIRNAAACCELGMPVADMLRSYLATADSPSSGRDLHVGGLQYGVLQPISHVGDVVPVTAGVALSFKLKGEPRVALTWIGDGSTKTAAAHEGTNFAAVQRLPAIFVIQNNQVALGTRLEQHQLPGNFDDWAASYGAWGARCDATTCSMRSRSPASPPSGVAVGRGRPCWWPTRSAWAGTPRTTSVRRATRSRPTCSPRGGDATPSGSTRSISKKKA
jgi:TPP-dependent pyruvate/acetoin dehydrogenase alpha subunit